MRRLLLLTVFLFAAGWTTWQLVGLASDDAKPRSAGWDLTPPDPAASPVVATGQLQGIYPVGSRVQDDKAPGGFGGCDNWPLPLGDKTWGAKGVVSLIAFPDEPVAYFKNRGIGLRLVNRGTKVEPFQASDSCLFIIQEALDDKGQWREIENLPCPICGNSFHRVFLKPGEYWEMKARTYSGPFKTKIRFRLDPSGENDTAPSIYSNAFDGEIAKAQLRRGPGQAALRRAMRSDDPNDGDAIKILVEAVANAQPRFNRFEIGASTAAGQLGAIGPAAKEALPALLVAMTNSDDSLRAAAAYAVWRIDGRIDESVKTLVAVLKGKNEYRESLEAAARLREMGPTAQDAVPALCSALHEGDESLRRKAAEALGAIRRNEAVAVPALAKALRDRDWYVRCGAGQALGEYGQASRPALPDLLRATKDEDGHVKVAAAYALFKIEGKAEPAVTALLETLKEGDKNSYARDSAAETLGKIGPLAKSATPELTALLKSDDRGLRISAAGAVWKISGDASASLPVLIRAIQEGTSLSESDTHTALGLLEQMGPEAKAAVPVLLAAHGRAEDWTRDEVERTLTKIDPAAAKTIQPRESKNPR